MSRKSKQFFQLGFQLALIAHGKLRRGAGVGIQDFIARNGLCEVHFHSTASTLAWWLGGMHTFPVIELLQFGSLGVPSTWLSDGCHC